MVLCFLLMVTLFMLQKIQHLSLLVRGCVQDLDVVFY